MVPVIATMFGLLLIGMSIVANARFRREDRLPMQWSVSGSVNWSAPRVPALMFTPALAICVLTLFVVGAMNVAPRPGQEGMVVPALAGLGSAFVVAHLFHLWLIAKALRRNAR